ncbi:CAP domain-containing protein [Paenibacillus sp. MBLB4367]|uniref:CAP domain-containing protein n=1 Tax=Paenibacillus sp. MBLB4367 TaxID=3384767 RepID=UPI003907F360
MQRFKKVAMTGVLVLGPIISAGAASASAAPCIVPDNAPQVAAAKQYGIDLGALLQGNKNFNNINVNDLLAKLGVKAPDFSAKPGTGNGAGTGAGSTGGGSGAGTGTGSQTGSGTTGGSQQGSNANASQSAYASQVVDLVNQERAKAGLKPLSSDSALAAMALDKAKDMYTNNYFDHNSPTYGSPFDMMKSYGIRYTYAGENIAKGQRTPQEVMTAWMNSAGHRQNILSPNFTKIGVAYYNGEWVQEFIAN